MVGLADSAPPYNDSMSPIQVRPCVRGRAFDSVEAAVRHTFSHPLQPNARRDAERLQGAALVDARWTDSEWWLRFDCGLTLHAWAAPDAVRWSLDPAADEPAGGSIQRVGAAPVVLDFVDTCGLWPMDRSALVAERRGAIFSGLFVSEHGLFVYFRGHLILQLLRVERVVDSRLLLAANEDD